MIRYRLLLCLLALPISIFTLWLAFRDKELRYLTQRLGINSFKHFKKNNGDLVWIHAASVGEVNAAAPFITELSKNNSIVLTSNTVSSANRAKNIFGTTIHHFYCPIDWQWAVTRFISKIQPNYLFIIETELWPTLFSVCNNKKIPITIINGRLSPKTLNASQWIKKRYSECLGITQAVLSRSNEDTQNFISLGASSKIVKTIGNIKYYPNNNIDNVQPFSCDVSYILAASTRNNEEKIIVSNWLEAQKKITDRYLLIIAPRHPHRLPLILEQLEEFNLNIAVRSRDDMIQSNTDVYIADTFGELISFIKGATFVLMGGSFVSKGGQNIIEVAHARKTVVFGKSMYNFKEEAKLFIQHQAGIQVNDNNLLASEMISLLTEKNKIQIHQENAAKLMQQHQNILNNYLAEIKSIYPDIKL